MTRKKHKAISFADMYGLGLLASRPGQNVDIIQHLSPEAQKIAKEIVEPKPSAPKEVKSAARELANLAK